MVVNVEHELLRGLGLSEQQALVDLAIGLFTEKKVTLGRAAKLADMTHSDFQKELGRRGIPIHYDVEDFREDMKTLAELR